MRIKWTEPLFTVLSPKNEYLPHDTVISCMSMYTKKHIIKNVHSSFLTVINETTKLFASTTQWINCGIVIIQKNISSNESEQLMSTQT